MHQSEEDEHQCYLLHQDPDALTQIIDSGAFIKLRRKFRNAFVISKYHPDTAAFFKSRATFRQEMVRHLFKYYNMIHPFSLFCLYWEMWMFFMYTFLFLLVPFNAVSIHEYNFALNHANYFAVLLLVADMIKTFFTGYWNENHSVSVLKQSTIIKKYLSTYFFVDLFIITHLLGMVFIPRSWWPLRKYGFLLRIVRIPRWLNCLDYLRKFLQISNYSFKAIKVMTTFVVILLWGFTLIYFIIILGAEREINKYEGFFAATKLLLVVGVDNTLTGSPWSTLLSVLFVNIGFIMQMFLYAQIMQVWNKYSKAQVRNQNLGIQFQEFMKHRELPISMRNKICDYANIRFRNAYFRETVINKMTSNSLKKQIQLIITKELVEKIDFFKKLPHSVIIDLVTQMKSEIFMPNDVIVSAGSEGTCMYFIYFGTVAIYTPSGKEICHLEDGAYFGEISLFLDEKRVASVIAVTPCELYMLKRNNFFKALEPFPHLFDKIKNLARQRLMTSRGLEV